MYKYHFLNDLAEINLTFQKILIALEMIKTREIIFNLFLILNNLY